MSPVHWPAPADIAAVRDHLVDWIDPRAPDGVTILAPYERYMPREHPGILTGEGPKPMMLFDLEADRAEQHDVAAEHPEVVQRLKSLYDATVAEMPSDKQ